MKISWMINPLTRRLIQGKYFSSLVYLAFLGLTISAVAAAKPPKELQRVMDDFLSMKNTSMRIEQVIDWRFASNNDSLYLNIDILADQQFHVTIPVFGMEIYVNELEMMSINHIRQQLIYENSTSDALINQLFVGGDLRDARFKKELIVKGGGRKLEFVFSGDFSDWDRMSLTLDQNEQLVGMTLVDYDGNKYLIDLIYKENFENFRVPDIKSDYPDYQIADLRDDR